MHICWDASTHTKIYESDENKNNKRLNNQSMIILGTYDIWSLFYSGISTHISDPSEFY